VSSSLTYFPPLVGVAIPIRRELKLYFPSIERREPNGRSCDPDKKGTETNKIRILMSNT